VGGREGCREGRKEGGRERGRGCVCAFCDWPLGDRHGARGRSWTGREGGRKGEREGGLFPNAMLSDT